MTPEQLELLLFNTPDIDKLVDILSTLNEEQRKLLSTFTNKLRKQIVNGKTNSDSSERFKNYLKKHKNNYWNTKVYINIQLATYAICPLSILKQNTVFVGRENKYAISRIILNRKPKWIDEWLAHELEQETQTITFSMIHEWIREGICKKPEVDGYTRMFACSLMSYFHQPNEKPNPPISQRLRAEPDLLDDIWRLFEVENQAFITEDWLTKNAPENHETWPEALCKLAIQGVIDRQRLLDSTLQGLHLNLKQNQLSGFHKFHEKLCPNNEELTERQSEYIVLLGHKVSHVVKFALKVLYKLEKSNLLNETLFINEVSTVFYQPAKGNAICALKLIQKTIKKNVPPTIKTLTAIAQALRHPNADVQSTGLKILNTHKTFINNELKSELRSMVSYIADSLKPTIFTIIGKQNSSRNKHNITNDYNISDLKQRLSELSAEQRKVLGLNDINLEDGSDNIIVHPISPKTLILPVLEHTEIIEPIDDLDTLIQTIAHAIEVVNDPENVERILDGLSRLCNQKPKDFTNKVAPLLRRLESGAGLGSLEGITGGSGGLRLALADLILSWLTGQRYHSPGNKYFSPIHTLEPTIIRIRGLIERVLQQQSQPMLAAPTHVGGWIDPRIWVERLNKGEHKNFTLDRMDLCQSMLRLTPDQRNTALANASTISGNLGRVVRFALGETQQFSISDQHDYDLWITAARAREAKSDWSKTFTALKISDQWPDSTRPANFRWCAYEEEKDQHKIARLDISVFINNENSENTTTHNPVKHVFGKLNRALSSEIQTDYHRIPSAAINHQSIQKYRWSSDLNTTWIAKWLPSLWPTNPDALYCLGITQLIGRIDMHSSNWEPNFGFLHGLFDLRRPWSELAHLLLCIGLIGKDADSRALAIDALIEGIEDGRASNIMLTDILAQLSNSKWLKLDRFSKSLYQIVQISTLHTFAINEILQSWLTKVDIQQANIYRILEVMRETVLILDSALSISAINSLKKLNGNDKAERIAKQLIAINPNNKDVINSIKLKLIKTRLDSYELII